MNAPAMSFREFSLLLLYALSSTMLFRCSCWAATHDELPQCGITGVYKARQTLLQSPNYPDNYSPSICLDYVIRSPYRCPTKFHIQFLDFLLESSNNCTNDYLAIGLENDDDDMDILCGQVVGIKKYHTPDGVLRLRFFADDSPWTTARGFKLLITRLACEREELVRPNIDSNDDGSEIVNAPLPEHTLPGVFRNLSLQDQHVPYPLMPLHGLNYQNPFLAGAYASRRPQPFQIPVLQVPQADDINDKPCTPTQDQLPHIPQLHQELPLIPDQYSNWHNPAIEGKSSTAENRQQIIAPISISSPTEPCCASSFGQKRFYLSSPGFPRTAFTSILPTQQRDCQFELEKYSRNVCRLRVEFKFFDFGQTYSGTGARQGNIEVAIGTSKDVCTEDFIQIDEERFCGCRTGYVFHSLWGFGKKLIRMRIGYSGIPSSGFLLDIFQEDCSGLQYVPSNLAGAQNLLAIQPDPSNVGIAVQPNGFTNFGQQQTIPNLLGINAQQSAIGGQQQASVFPNQQYYPQYYPQNNPLWMQPQQQLPFNYPMPQFRSTRDPKYVAAESTQQQPVSVVETNSTRKEYYYFDGDEAFARARLADEPDDPDKMVNTHYDATARRGRCTFDTMDILRLSVDYNWITKPTCYSPQGRWFSNLFG